VNEVKQVTSPSERKGPMTPYKSGRVNLLTEIHKSFSHPAITGVSKDLISLVRH